MPIAPAATMIRSGIQAVQQVIESLAFLADPVLLRDEEVLDEDRVRVHGGATHLRNATHLDLLSIELREEDGHAVGGLRAVLERRRARQQQDVVGNLRGRCPDLAAVDEITAVDLLREGLDLRRVEPGVRLGDAEAGLLRAGDQRAQHALLLLGSAQHDDRMRGEQVDLQRRHRRRAAAARGDGIHHDRRLGHAEVRAAEFLRHRDAEPAVRGHRGMKLVRELRRRVLVAPVLVGEPRADALHRICDGTLVVSQIEVHGNPRTQAGALAGGQPSKILRLTISRITSEEPPAMRRTRASM